VQDHDGRRHVRLLVQLVLVRLFKEAVEVEVLGDGVAAAQSLPDLRGDASHWRMAVLGDSMSFAGSLCGAVSETTRWREKAGFPGY